MSRAAFYEALVGDTILNGYGINDDTVFHNWSKEERPSDATPFVILRWGEESKPLWGSETERGPRELSIWVHYPLEITNDFTKINVVLDRIDALAREQRDVVGTDGYTLSFVTVGGRSPDITDDGFNTITRHGEFQLYSVPSA